MKHFALCKTDIKAKRPEGVINFILTSLDVDRDSEVVMPMGVKIDNFIKNPVFLWVHDNFAPPIGKVIPDTIKITADEMRADVKFDLQDKFAKLIYNKYKSGYLNAGSIRFLPLKTGKPILEGQKWDTYIESELLEFSGVPIPSNPNALAQKDLDQIETEEEKKFVELVKKYLDNYSDGDGWREVLNKFYNDDDDDDDDDDDEEEIIDETELDGKEEEQVKGEIEIDDVPTEPVDELVELKQRVDKLYEMMLNPYLKDAMIWLQDYNLDDWEETAEAMNSLIDEKELSLGVKDKIYDILRKQYIKFEKTPPERTICISKSIDDLSANELIKLLKEGDNELYSDLVKTVADLLN